jgi:hypothetical protein
MRSLVVVLSQLIPEAEAREVVDRQQTRLEYAEYIISSINTPHDERLQCGCKEGRHTIMASAIERDNPDRRRYRSSSSTTKPRDCY